MKEEIIKVSVISNNTEDRQLEYDICEKIDPLIIVGILESIKSFILEGILEDDSNNQN